MRQYRCISPFVLGDKTAKRHHQHQLHAAQYEPYFGHLLRAEQAVKWYTTSTQCSQSKELSNANLQSFKLPNPTCSRLLCKCARDIFSKLWRVLCKQSLSRSCWACSVHIFECVQGSARSLLVTKCLRESLGPQQRSFLICCLSNYCLLSKSTSNSHQHIGPHRYSNCKQSK